MGLVLTDLVGDKEMMESNCGGLLNSCGCVYLGQRKGRCGLCVVCRLAV